MAVLILLSAFFSGSEAAFFSLSPRQRRQLPRSGVGGRIAERLLGDSEQLLSAILFWNLLINMTYFAIASIVAGRLESSSQGGATWALGFTAVSLLTIIFFSEMLPKSIAVLSPARTAVLVAPPLSLAVRIVWIILPLIRTANVLSSRLLWPAFEPENEIDLADIERAVELGTDDAALLERERVALRSLVEIADTRVSELMRPRSKLQLIASPIEDRIVLDDQPPGGYLMVTDSEGQAVIGSLAIRMLRPSQLDHVNEFIEPVIYVPWSAKVARVLDQLNENDLNVAVVVDEYGDAIGALSSDRIFRRMLAPQQDHGGETPHQIAIERLAPDHYRVRGLTSLRQLAKELNVPLTDESVATVAGYIQRCNERLPRLGDQSVLGPYLLTVIEESDGELAIDVTRKGEGDEGATDDARDAT
ncbi:DUF21 domain-containing protein [Roseiconus nitratireducens]|uniref:DUF21 domain-containing protein n=2 Tax=Roseiconus nitratireducens TaxID=2605748 RepID=A0A5M6DAV3_9BACT|nr:DUF21 domain-containing protein [Roseiconus nitratireducens]